MNIKRIWNGSRGFIFEDEDGKTWNEFCNEEDSSIKNKLLYTFYDPEKVRFQNDYIYAGSEYIIEFFQIESQVNLTIVRQKEPSKKIFVFTKFQI